MSLSLCLSVSAFFCLRLLEGWDKQLKVFGAEAGQRGEDERSPSKSSHNPLPPNSQAVIIQIPDTETTGRPHSGPQNITNCCIFTDILQTLIFSYDECIAFPQIFPALVRSTCTAMLIEKYLLPHSVPL